jgi:uncharacterized protein involved in exopolysaccharide biosynthesis
MQSAPAQLSNESPAYEIPERFSDAAHKKVSDEIRLQDVLRLLYRRRWVIAGIVSFSLGTAVAYNFLATPIYEARTRVLIEPAADAVVPFGASGQDLGRSDYFLTQLDVIRSQALARDTLERLRVLSPNAAQQAIEVDQFIAALSVSTSKNDVGGESRVVTLGYRSKDPKMAARLVNGLAQAYVDHNLALRKQGSLEATKWLNQRVDELRGQVNSTETALQRYREQKDAVSLDDRQNIVVQKFGQLNANLTSARTERVQKQTLYEQLVALQRSGAALDTFPPILGNTFIQGLKAELAGLQRERSQLAERLGDLHPDMIKVNTAIQNAQSRLNGEIAKVVDGIKNDYAAAQANEQALASALEAQKREVLDLNKKSIDYNALQRDAVSTQQIYDIASTREGDRACG